MDKRQCRVGVLDWRYRVEFTWRDSTEMHYAYDRDDAFETANRRRGWNGLLKLTITDEATGQTLLRHIGKINVGRQLIRSPRRQPLSKKHAFSPVE